eukprot:m.27821 g.27821  ORF g.27821 m.27821 type:complete len:290 (+) comp30375_c0_seq2:2-871(+)
MTTAATARTPLVRSGFSGSSLARSLPAINSSAAPPFPPHQPITTQPTSSSLDPLSHAVYRQTIRQCVDSAGRFNSVVNSLAQSTDQDLERAKRDTTIMIPDDLTDERLLQELLVDGEEVMTQPEQWVPFAGATLVDVERPEKERKLSGGFLVLTNKRLILLNRSAHLNSQLRSKKGTTTSSISLSLSSLFTSAALYFPIPLRCLRSVELAAISRASWLSSIENAFDCCAAMYKWKSFGPKMHALPSRILRFGLAMETSMRMEIQLIPSHPFELLVNLLSKLQKMAEGLQ